MDKQLTKAKSNELSKPQPTSPQVSIGGLIRSEQEKQVYLATQDKQIKFISSNTEMNELLKVVTTWRLYLGIKEDASKEELVLITNFIKDNYPEFTKKEIESAYKLAITNKLNVDAEPYGKFSPIYVARILNAYRTFKTETMAQIRIRKNQFEREQQLEKPKTKEELIEAKKNHILWYIQTLNQKTDYVGDYNKWCWDFMTKNKIITGDNVNFAKAKEEAENLKNRNIRNIFLRVFQQMTLPEREKEEQVLLEMYGRYYLLKQYFSNVRNPKQWLEQFNDDQFL